MAGSIRAPPTTPAISARNSTTSADVERAKALLKEAGYNGEEFCLLTDSNIPEHNKAAVVIAENLKAVGINAKINQVDWPTALKIRLQPERLERLDPDDGHRALSRPGWRDLRRSPGRTPHFVKNDPELEAPTGQLISGKTVEDRQATFKKIQKRLYEFFGIIKIGDTGMMQATRSNVEGLQAVPLPAHVRRLVRELMPCD